MPWSITGSGAWAGNAKEICVGEPEVQETRCAADECGVPVAAAGERGVHQDRFAAFVETVELLQRDRRAGASDGGFQLFDVVARFSLVMALL